MRSAEKCVVSAVLVKASELARTVLGRMTVRSRFVYCVQVTGVVIKIARTPLKCTIAALNVITFLTSETFSCEWFSTNQMEYAAKNQLSSSVVQ